MAVPKKTTKRKSKASNSKTTKRTPKRASKKMLELQGQIEAINRSQAVIEFDLDGNILFANENFLSVMGYTLEEVQGKHHRMFVEQAYAASTEYREFWSGFRAGIFRADEFKRVGNNGREVWIQATYNPIFDDKGAPFKVVKYATDVTESKMISADMEAQIDAIHKSQAVIEFNLDGTIRTANSNFLSTLGYELHEIQGQHHRLFVDNETSTSPEYHEFWAKLNRGEFAAGEFKRFGKDGKEVWIQASYNPILDLNGKPFKIVKFASDVTVAKDLERQVRESEQRMKIESEEQQRKIDELLVVVNAVAFGDLSIDIPDLGEDGLGKVAKTFEMALNAMKATLIQVRHVADEVASNSKQLASVSDEIASGAQEQASSLEETAASLEEITSAVKQNSDNSVQAQQLSSSSSEVADSGGSVVGEAVHAMTAINKSTGKATDIITTIDEIAFQTNLLALNAAVEAARAGEQGRGFAVVASEVRNLAQRSAGAAKEIKQLLQDSFSAVETGTDLVNKSGETFSEIVTSVKRVADIVAEISSASMEQLSGIEQVNNAVSQMDRVTQANASQTQQMSSTSNSLQAQSEYLFRLVNEFNLGVDDAEDSRTGSKTPVGLKRKSTFEAPKNDEVKHGLPVDLDSIGMSGEGSFVEF